jgi:hypothetical protein
MILSRGSMILSKNLWFWAKIYYFEPKSIILSKSLLYILNNVYEYLFILNNVYVYMSKSTPPYSPNTWGGGDKVKAIFGAMPA